MTLKYDTSRYTTITCTGYGAGDCGVRTIYAITGLPQEECLQLATKHGYSPRAGITTLGIIDAVREALGDDPAEEILPWLLGWEYSKPTRTFKRYTQNCPTLLQFVKDHPKGIFVVTTIDHVFAVIDGVVHDHRPVKGEAGEDGLVETTSGQRRRLTAAYDVETCKPTHVFVDRFPEDMIKQHRLTLKHYRADIAAKGAAVREQQDI